MRELAGALVVRSEVRVLYAYRNPSPKLLEFTRIAEKDEDGIETVRLAQSHDAGERR